MSSHIQELRLRLGLVSIHVLCWFFLGILAKDWILVRLIEPACTRFTIMVNQRGCVLATDSPLGGLNVVFTLGIMMSAIPTIPLLIWQGWLFLRPACAPRIQAHGTQLSGLLIAGWIGSVMLSIVLIDPILQAVIAIGAPWVQPLLFGQAYLWFLIHLMLGCFVLIAVMEVVGFALWVGWLQPVWINRYRAQIILGLFALSAVITPTQDPFTMIGIGLIPAGFIFGLSRLIQLAPKLDEWTR